MKTLSRLGTVAALALAVAGPTSLLASPASAAAHDPAPVFVQSDNLSGNTVTVYDRAADGTLTEGATVATGGLGGALTGSVVDHLASQGGLGYDADRGLLYAVNAGSDSLTTFLVNGDRLVRHQVLGTHGTFPASVTTRGDVVYVLNARDGGSIQGYRAVGRNLVAVPAWHRDLGLDPNATPEFTHTPGQVAFTPDGSRLLVTTKGNTSAIDVFDVSASGAVSDTPTVTSLPGAVPFGVVFDAAGRVAVAEAGTNAVATFTIAGDDTLAPVAYAATGQAATCWIVRTGDFLYASNAGGGNVTGYRTDGAALAPLGNTATGAGSVDAAASSDGRNVYVQTGGTGSVAEFSVGADGSLTRIGTVLVPGAIGGEGIVAG
jgi:6-phosphogluconolactonase (cycloisomerase 2 family)